VLTPDRAAIAGVYPFTLEPRVHRVQVNGHVLCAMRALDAPAIAPVFGIRAPIASRCRVSGQPVAIRMRGGRVTEAQPADTRVGIRWQGTAGGAAQSRCLERVFLWDRAAAGGWRQADPDNISRFGLPAAVSFGAAYFRPLLA
jgi:hypothetical protein